MRHLLRLSSVGVLVAASSICATGVGCSDADAAPEIIALRRHFPGAARRILDGPKSSSFEVVRNGFAGCARPHAKPGAHDLGAEGCEAGLGALFPKAAPGVIRLSLPDGTAFAVRDLRAQGAGRFASGALTYPTRSGTVYWTLSGFGFEQWVYAESAGESAVGEWEIEGAALRPRGGGIDLLDARGRHRITVAAPSAYDAAGHAVRPWLTTWGSTIRLYVESGELPLLVDPLWLPAGTLGAARAAHTATLLPNGRILVAGGTTGTTPLSSAELYDPATGAFGPAPPMGTPRESHTATLLPGGRVLVVGGRNSTVASPTAEIYDAAQASWFPVPGSLVNERYLHTATLLPDGRVLFVGGYGSVGGAMFNVEWYC